MEKTGLGEKWVQTAVPDNGWPPGALVLTKRIEYIRFEVEDIFIFGKT